MFNYVYDVTLSEESYAILQNLIPTAAYQSAIILNRLAGANLQQSHRQLARARELLAQSIERLRRIKRLLGVEH